MSDATERWENNEEYRPPAETIREIACKVYIEKASAIGGDLVAEVERLREDLAQAHRAMTEWPEGNKLRLEGIRLGLDAAADTAEHTESKHFGNAIRCLDPAEILKGKS